EGLGIGGNAGLGQVSEPLNGYINITNEDLFYQAPYPVVEGLAAGHGEENLLLPFGVKMALDGKAGLLYLLESPVT
ncbi:MAG: hypothetical protein IH857_02100, partial [Deltaproteobacteria bacterium]|nr:hypothetical protein [Deltaproteobacteria bacterium]